MRRSLTVEQQRRDFIDHAFPTATGDVVVVACTPVDPMNWLFDQMGPYDALHVCVETPGGMVWWNALIHHKATGAEAAAGTPTMGELGLSTDTAIVSDLVRSDSVSHDRPLLLNAAAT